MKQSVRCPKCKMETVGFYEKPTGERKCRWCGHEHTLARVKGKVDDKASAVEQARES